MTTGRVLVSKHSLTPSSALTGNHEEPFCVIRGKPYSPHRRFSPVYGTTVGLQLPPGYEPLQYDWLGDWVGTRIIDKGLMLSTYWTNIVSNYCSLDSVRVSDLYSDPVEEAVDSLREFHSYRASLLAQ